MTDRGSLAELAVQVAVLLVEVSGRLRWEPSGVRGVVDRALVSAQELAEIFAGGVYAEADTLKLGPGVVTLTARARFAQGPAALSAPLLVEIRAAAATPAKPVKPVRPPKPARGKDPKPAPAAASGAGLKLTATDEKGKAHEGVLAALTDEALTRALGELKLPQPRSLVLEGEIQVATDGLYELVLGTSGAVTATWAGARALDMPAASAPRLAFAAGYLKAGWNALRIELAPDGPPRLSALLSGAQVAAPVAPAALRHE